MDGQSFTLFAQHWNYTYKTMFNSKEGDIPSPPPTPIFDPQLFDREADGDIDGEALDPEIVKRAHTLPTPHYEIPTNGISKTQEPAPILSPSSSLILHFTRATTQRILQAANPPGAKQKIGMQPALIAHLWRSINRARGLDSDPREMNLALPFDLRRRLSLPASTMGSSVIHADFHLPGRTICSSPLSSTAFSIKSAIEAYETYKLKALLHELAYEIDPRRYEGHPGRVSMERSLVVTVMPRMGFYSGFGFEGGVARLVIPVTVQMRGLVLVTEGRPMDGSGAGEGKHWCDDGVDVMMTLEKEVMERLVGDEEFLFGGMDS